MALDDLDDGVELSYYWALLRPWRLRIALAAFAIGVATLLVTKFLFFHYYRAEGILRPASQEPQSTVNLGGLLGSISGGISGNSGSLLSSLFGTGTPTDVNEHMTIVSTYDFTMGIVERFNLGPRVCRKNWYHDLEALVGMHPYSRYSQYLAMEDRLDYSYDDKLGNLELDFEDTDAQFARKVLQGYVDGLRARLRNQAMLEASLAVKALEAELGKTSDSLLINQLDQLIAQEIQQEKTAEVQADFAFTVEEPPYVSDRIYTPWPLLDAAIAAVATCLLAVMWVVVRDRLTRSHRDTQRLVAVGLEPEEAPSAPEEEGLRLREPVRSRAQKG
ncbi:MAG: hypothetical protein WA005_13785 [Candidatus Binataceae bacterium]